MKNRGNRSLFEAEADSTGDLKDLYRSVFQHDRVENHCSLKSGFARLFGVLRKDLRYQDGTGNTAPDVKDVKHVLAKAAVLTRSNAGSVSRAVTVPVAWSDTVTVTGTRRRRTWNTVGIANVQQVQMRE